METSLIGLTSEQAAELTAPTPKEVILTRPSPWGGEMEYISGEYVKRTLMSVFKGAFRVTVRNIETIEDVIVVHITLEYPLLQFCKGGDFVNEEWGRIDEVGVSTIRSQGNSTNFSTAIKAAHTDALKRAATHLGIGLDLYEKTNIEEEKNGGAPAWVQSSQKPVQSPPKTEYKPKASFTSSGNGGATEKQTGLMTRLAGELHAGWTPEWLHKVTGVPEERFLGDMSSLTRAEASSVIDTLLEMKKSAGA